MRVKALKDFTVPNQKAFAKGIEYDILEPIAKELLERKLVCKVTSLPPEETKSTKKKRNDLKS